MSEINLAAMANLPNSNFHGFKHRPLQINNSEAWPVRLSKPFVVITLIGTPVEQRTRTAQGPLEHKALALVPKARDIVLKLTHGCSQACCIWSTTILT